jgi:preprotein translocase subunit YajC
MWDFFVVVAQEGAKSAPALPFDLFFLTLWGMLVLMIFLNRGRANQDRERQELINGLRKNDEVLTNAGIYGTIVSVSDKEDKVVVKVDDNTRIKMLKNAIIRNITRDEEKKAELEQQAKAKDTK